MGSRYLRLGRAAPSGHPRHARPGGVGPVARLDAAAFADWLAALIRATCDDKPALVAHSLGGGLAARFAVRRADPIRRLVLYGTPRIGPYRMPMGLRVAAIRFGLRPTERNSERFDRWAFFDLDRVRRQNPEWLRAWGAYTMSRATIPHVKRTMRQLIGSCTKQSRCSGAGTTASSHRVAGAFMRALRTALPHQ